MAEQASLVQDGVDRFREAFESLDLQRMQKQIQARRKAFEKQIASGRRQWEKRTRKQVKRFRTELRRNTLLKRAQELQKDAMHQLESGVDGLLTTLRIASKGDVDRLDRRLGQISRKLKDLERPRRGNGGAGRHV
jgi:hypothetical protein